MPCIGLPTEVGDVTVHLSGTLHEATPPVSHERRVMYTGFGLPDRADVAGSNLLGNLRKQVNDILRDEQSGHQRSSDHQRSSAEG